MMTDIFGRRCIARWTLVLNNLKWMALVWMALTGCSGGNGDSGALRSDGSDLKVQLAWQTTGAESATRPAPSNLDACLDFQITGIYVRVKDAAGQIVTKSGIVPCSDHGVQLGKVPAQSGCIVEVEGYVGDEVRWFGQSGEVSVTAGQSAEPVSVAMNFTGVASAPPTATILPADAAADVPTDTLITVGFDKAVVASSIHEASIRITNGSDLVPGSVVYDADALEAVFQPDRALAVSTTYTITVTTDVLDPHGQQLSREATSRFSTPTVWYVDASSAASGPGNTWPEAFRTISEAVTAAGGGDQIWVKHGTYQPARQIAIDKPVELLGGFEGTETQLRQRDGSAWETVVDGKGERRCFYLSSDVTLDGFTITGGSIGNTDEGGAVYIDKAAPRIKNCLFVDNTVDGSLILNSEGGGSISGCIFRNNRVMRSSNGGLGSTIKNAFAKSTTINHCRFDSNFSDTKGGAIVNYASDDISISGCRFVNNIGTGAAGAIYSAQSIIYIQNCIFNGNRAEAINGYAHGGAIVNDWQNEQSIKNCTFAYNEAVGGDTDDTKGGAIYISSGVVSGKSNIINSIIWGNQAKSDPNVYNDTSSNTTITQSHIGYADPLFDADLHLRAESPCINNADSSAAPALDVDGEVRPQGTLPDQGADEFVDSDNDHMPDYWEALHGVSLAGSDEDGDNIPNLSEYHLGTDPNNAQLVIDETLRGAVREDGLHDASDSSTPTGISGGYGYRSFFVFDVTDLPPVKTAAVRLELVDYISGSASVQLYLREVSANTAALSTDLSGQSGIDIYNDLGSGTIYDGYESNPAEKGTVLDIQLSQAAVDDINTARSGSGQFIIGLGLDSNVKDGHLLFSNADEIRTHQLILIQE